MATGINLRETRFKYRTILIFPCSFDHLPFHNLIFHRPCDLCPQSEVRERLNVFQYLYECINAEMRCIELRKMTRLHGSQIRLFLKKKKLSNIPIFDNLNEINCAWFNQVLISFINY